MSSGGSRKNKCFLDKYFDEELKKKSGPQRTRRPSLRPKQKYSFSHSLKIAKPGGRGRAEDSSYTLVAGEGSGLLNERSVNEYREKMMSKAIDKVKKLDQGNMRRELRNSRFRRSWRKECEKPQEEAEGMKKETPSKVNSAVKAETNQSALGKINFLVTYDEKRKNINKWNELGIQLPAF
ncbi:hypothetical protein J4Q44_G00372240 [Coregonus suidteri]|uniref:Uncharacterized protein n=1 Tax=Coregonus suidteri TaxID=861788 RepID=A0AAN8Q680_9TELE